MTKLGGCALVLALVLAFAGCASSPPGDGDGSGVADPPQTTSQAASATPEGSPELEARVPTEPPGTALALVVVGTGEQTQSFREQLRPAYDALFSTDAAFRVALETRVASALRAHEVEVRVPSGADPVRDSLLELLGDYDLRTGSVPDGARAALRALAQREQARTVVVVRRWQLDVREEAIAQRQVPACALDVGGEVFDFRGSLLTFGRAGGLGMLLAGKEEAVLNNVIAEASKSFAGLMARATPAE